MQELSGETAVKLAYRLGDQEGRKAMRFALSKYSEVEAYARLYNFLLRVFEFKNIDISIADKLIIEICNAILKCDSFMEEFHIHETVNKSIQILK